MWKEFDDCVNKMFVFTNGKKIILWGYERSGFFIEHLFARANKQIEYIIDDSGCINPKIPVYRSFIINDMDKDTHAILITFTHDEKVKDFLDNLGYVQNEHYIFLRDLFYKEKYEKVQRKLSYYDWMEYSYNLDIIKMKTLNAIQRVNNDSLYYSAGVDYSLVDVLDNFIFTEKDAIFDFGCGKGGTLLLFNKAGIKKLGGVEYDKELYLTACENMKKINLMDAEIINDNAVNVTNQLDKYNYFLCIIPFKGIHSGRR